MKKQWKRAIGLGFGLLMVTGLLLATHLQKPLSFDDLWTIDAPYSPAPAQPGESIFLLSGPAEAIPAPTQEQLRPYHLVIRWLRSYSYRPVFHNRSSPQDGGIFFSTSQGCTPVSMAYWSEGVLWICDGQGGWRSYVPDDMEDFSAKLEELLPKIRER